MKALSEAHILDLLAKHFPENHPSLLLGRGDDCAVIRSQGSLCISTDLFIEDVHFRSSYFTPGDIGYKSLAVNISDIAAMGVRPTGFSLGLAIPQHTDTAWLEAFFHGMGQLAAKHNMVLSGGDISKAEKIHICISIWGETGQQKQLQENNNMYLTRGGAMPGDVLFLVGNIGLARIGLEKLEKYGREAQNEWPVACAAHLRPQPQVDAGLILSRAANNARPPVLMDVSDGLARDLQRLLGMEKENILGAHIVLPEALLHPEVIRHAKQKGLCAAEEAYLGGEDYALFGACMPKLLPILHAAIPHIRSIGSVSDAGVIELNGKQMPRAGFDHFAV